MQGLLLGLSTGTVCLAYCAPVLVPLILGEGEGTNRNFIILGQFLIGRLAGYLLFGVIAWFAGKLLLNTVDLKRPVLGAVYAVMAITLICYGLYKPRRLCAGEAFQKYFPYQLKKNQKAVSICFGFLTGINLCPPFLLAFAGAANAGRMLQSVFFFFTFFIGTSLFFLPIPYIGMLKSNVLLKDIGKMAAVVVAIYYLYTGIIMFAEGVKIL